MADNMLTEEDDDGELVPVETPPESDEGDAPVDADDDDGEDAN